MSGGRGKGGNMGLMGRKGKGGNKQRLGWEKGKG